MNWYYAEGSQQMGPITQEQFNSLVASGKITPQTLVWKEGMSEWRPYKDVITPPPAAARVACSECNQSFPEDQVVRYGPLSVCASCRPAFIKRIKDGAPLGDDMEYAGFWIRFVAKIIDSFIVSIPVGIIAAIVALMSGPRIAEAMVALNVLLQVVYYGCALALNIFFVGHFGATPGKMALGLKVVCADGSKVSYARATGRAFAEILSGIICYIGFIMAGFDDEKRTLHDRICETRVIKK